MKVDISGPFSAPEDGPFLVELEDVLSHRIVISLGDRRVLDMDVRHLFLKGLMHGENATRFDLYTGLTPPAAPTVNPE